MNISQGMYVGHYKNPEIRKLKLGKFLECSKETKKGCQNAQIPENSKRKRKERSEIGVEDQ